MAASKQDALESELRRCDAEIAEILTRPDIDVCPAWLVTLGVQDWEYEKRLILDELSAFGMDSTPG